MLFDTFTGTDVNTHEVWNIGNDIFLRCLPYHISKTLSSKTMKTATSVRAIQCRVETNDVADRPCRILWPLMLAVALDIFHRTTQNGHWKVKIITIAAEGT